MTERIILGGGCFWCLEAVFKRLAGVKTVRSGYAGGKVINPTYEQVCSGLTGHAEVVEVVFDSATLRLDDVLELFFKAHDPTSLNRQGADVGSFYRSIILYTDEKQKPIIMKHLSSEMVTEVKPLDKFYEAEEYHQNYFLKNPTSAYCQAVIKPKLKELKKDRHDLKSRRE